MDDRDLIFGSITKALNRLPKRTEYPQWDDDLIVCREHPDFASDWELFSYKIHQTSGIALHGLEGLAEYIGSSGWTIGFCDRDIASQLSKLSAFAEIELATEYERERLDDYQFGITRAAGAVAETGTVVLKDTTSAFRLGALAPWAHIAVITSKDLYPDCGTSIKHFGNDPSIIWATGPSKTADVEGILIEGVHGPGVQACCLCDDL